MNMNTGSNYNNTIKNDNTKREIDSSNTLNNSKQYAREAIDRYNNTYSYGNTPEIETMDLSFATEQLEENKKTLTDKLKSFFNSLLGREDETSSNVSLDVSSIIKENSKESSIQLPPLESVSSGNDEPSIQLPPLESVSSGNDEPSILLPPLESVSSDNSFEQMDLEYCQIMIDILNEDIEKMKQEYYDLYGNNSSSVAGFKTTYEEDLQSVESAINTMFNQLETMLPIEYINQYFVENYEGEEITYDYLVGLYNEAFINGDVYYQDFFNEIVYGGFSKLQEHDSNLTDESINYLMESEVITLFENIVDKKSYVTDLLAPAVSLAQEIAKLEESKRNFCIYSQSYILEEHEAQTYDYEDFKEFFSDSDLSLMDENYDEARIYVYLYRNGRMDEAKEYRRCLETTLNQRQGWEWAKEWAIEVTSDDANLVSGLLATGGSGTWDGIVNSGMGYYHFLTNMIENDGVMTAEAYKQQFIMTMLSSTPSQESYVMENNDLNSSIIDETQQPVSFVESLFGKESPEYELYTKVQQLDKKYLYNFTYQIGLGFGNLLPTMLLSSSLSVCGVNPVVTNWVGIGANTISSFGNEVENNSLNGITGFESYLYAGFSVLSDAALDKLLGGLPVLSNNSGFNLKAFFGEGLNGAVQYAIKGILPRVLSGESLDLGDLCNMGKDTLTEFATSVALSVLSNGVQVPINFVVNGVNTMKIIDQNQAMLFCKYDDNGEPYFDSFGFAEYLFGLNSLSNGNNEAAIEHFVNADVWGLVGPENVQQILGSLDNKTLYDILTSSDSDIQSFFLANMSTLELNGLIHDISGFDYTDDDILLLNLHQQIQQSMSVETQNYNAANQEDVTDSTMIEAGEDIFGIDVESINNIEDLKNALNSIDLSKIDATDSEVIASLRTINEKLNAKGLPSISINGEHFIIDGLDFVSVYEGSVNTEKKTSEFVFKILNLPLSDEMKMKLIENMSDADKVKALEYLKSDGIKYKVVQSIDDLATRYNIFMYLLNDTTNDYLYDVEDDFKKCIMDELITFNSRELTDFLKDLKYDSYIRDVYYLINGNDDFIGMFISCIPNLSLKAEMLLSYDNYNKCSVDVVFNILSQLKGDDLLLFDTLNKLFFSSSKEDSFNYGLSTDLLNVSSNSELTTYIEAFIEYSYLSLEEKNSKSIFDTFVRKYGFEFSILFSFELFDNYTLEFLKSNYTFINCLSDINTQRQIKKMLCEYILGAESNEFKIFDSFIDYNPFILDNINCEILSSDIISSLGIERIIEMAMYPEVQKKVLDIYNTDNGKFNLFCNSIDFIEEYSKDILFQPLIENMFDVFLSEEFNDVLCVIGDNFDEIKNGKEFLFLILSMSCDKNIVLKSCLDDIATFKDLDDFSSVYYERLNSEYQKLYNKSNKTEDDVVNMKNLLLIDCFGITLDNAKYLLKQYDLAKDKLALDEDAQFVYDKLNAIINADSFPKHLMSTSDKDVYKYYLEAYTLEQNIKNVYSQHYMDKAYKIENNTPSEYRNVNVKDKKGNILIYQIPIYELDDDSILLIHKKDAFSSGNTSANNYVEQYNTPPDNDKAKQHHLSTSVISKDKGNIAMSSMPGLIYGYSNWNVESFVTMSNGDIYSESKYNITWRREANYMSSSELLDQTKNYNEIVFDRNGIKPSYMILTDDMSPDLVQKTYQAAYDWGIPIVCR